MPSSTVSHRSGGQFVSHPVVMSVDGTLAGDLAGSGMFGLGACVPALAPEAVFRAVACPAAPPLTDGSIGVTDCGSRRLESALRNAGFGSQEFRFLHPDRLAAAAASAKVLLLGSDDPLGRGPLAGLFHALWGGPPSWSARSVARLLDQAAASGSRPVVIAVGDGAWQWAADAGARREHGIDCAVVGEPERIVPELVRRALRGEALPGFVIGPPVAAENIPRLAGPVASGVVDVVRGAGRGCRFRPADKAPLRSLPLEAILEDVEINRRGGQRRAILLAPDLFLYGAAAVERPAASRPNGDAICGLLEAVGRVEGIEGVAPTHLSLSNVVAHEALLRRVAALLRLGLRGGPEALAVQVAVETGSVPLARRSLAAASAPFQAEDWPEVVRQGITRLWENHFAPVCSLTVGLPGETDADLRDTVRLLRQLRHVPSLFVPLLHKPGPPGESGSDAAHPAVTAGQAELVAAAFEHNLQWVDRLWPLSPPGRIGLAAVFRRTAVRALTALATHGARKLAVSLGADPGPRFGDWFPALPTPPSRMLLRPAKPRAVPPSLEAWSLRARVPGEHRLGW